jgi:hypothetical protein
MADQNGGGRGSTHDGDPQQIQGKLTVEGFVTIAQQHQSAADRPQSNVNSTSTKSVFDIVTRIIGIVVSIFVGFALFFVGWQQYNVMNSQIRAYVFQDRITVGRPIRPGSQITISFKNFGPTPAIISSAPATCGYFVSPPAPIVTNEITEFFSSVVMGAGEHAMDLERNVNASDDEFAKAKKGNGSIRCVYNVRYADVVGSSHITGLCLMYVYVTGHEGFIVCPEPQYRYKN